MALVSLKAQKDPAVNGKKKVKGKIDVSVTPAQHMEAVKTFINQCLRCRYNKAGLPKSKKASEESRAAVAKEAGDADESSFSVTKRLFKSCGQDAHPLIGDINDWARRVDRWRNTFTFSMAADDTADADSLKKAKGERLIRIDDVEDFENGLVEMELEGLKLSKKLYDSYDQIMALEKVHLKKEYRQSDYPDREQIFQSVERDGKTEEFGILRIGRRHYSEITASVRLPKVVLQRMTVQAEELMNQSVEVAVADIVSVIAKTFTTLAKQLVDRVRIRPPKSHPLYINVGTQAEVMDTREEKSGKFILLSWRDLKTSGQGRPKMITEEFGPYSEEEYQSLRPEPMEETKKLTSSVIDRLSEHLDIFNNLKTKLGAYGGHLDDILDAIRDVYHKATGNTHKKTEAMIEQIKHSAYFRNELKEELDGAVNAMLSVAEEAKKVRRKVHSNVALAAGKFMTGAKK
jgi:hypothetical protein